jgi:hypothetical protein
MITVNGFELGAAIAQGIREPQRITWRRAAAVAVDTAVVTGTVGTIVSVGAGIAWLFGAFGSAASEL